MTLIPSTSSTFEDGSGSRTTSTSTYSPPMVTRFSSTTSSLGSSSHHPTMVQVVPPPPQLTTNNSSGESSLSLGQLSTTKHASTTAKDPPTQVSSKVSAFVTFLKALFGVSLLSSPRIFNETGLLLGTLTYAIIIGACAFACFLLIQARSQLVATDSQQDRHYHAHIITYGELSRKLLGSRAAVIITFWIVNLHLLFGSGMMAGAIHELAAAMGWTSSNYYNNNNQNDDNGGDEYHSQYSSNSSNNDLDLMYRCLFSLCLFPLVCLLLQFRNVSDLFRICAAGLLVYMVGCVGSMLYVTILKSVQANENDDGSEDDADDEQRRWLHEGGGDGPLGPLGPAAPDAPTDLWEWKWKGLPRFVGSTMCAIEGINLALPTANGLSATPSNTVPIVCSVVFLFGLLTLMIAWVGYLGGLGGGQGTQHGEDSCQDISYCLDSKIVAKVHQVSLAAALILTLPIILFPSIEMLELWSNERRLQRENVTTITLQEELDHDPSSAFGKRGWNGFIVGNASIRHYSLMAKSKFEDSLLTVESIREDRPFRHRHWKLRVAHAVAVCFLGAIQRSFKPFFTLLTGVGLSFAGFMLPCLLYVYASKETQVSRLMKCAMAGLCLLGLCNVILVFVSVFTDHDFVSRRKQQQNHDDDGSGSHDDGEERW